MNLSLTSERVRGSPSRDAAAGSPSGPLLALCVSLPLALAWSQPFSYGISVEAFPLLLGLLVAALIGTMGLGRVPPALLAWVALVVGVLMLRGSAVPVYNLMLLPVGVAVWIGFALGDAALREVRVARAIGIGLAVGLGVNFVAAVLQFFHLEHHFRPWLAPGGWSIGSSRPYGNLRQANHLGMFFALSFAPLWWMAARQVLSPGGTAILAAAASLVVALSGSRISLLAVFAVALLAWTWRRSLPPRVLLVFLASPLAVLLFSWGVDAFAAWTGRGEAGVLTRNTESVSLRLLHWGGALELIEADPWWGVGWREFRYARFLLHPEHAAIEIAEHAHNLFLHLAAELGVPLTLLILMPVGVFVVRGQPWRERDPRVQAGWLVLLLLFLYSQVEFPLWVMNFQFLAAVAGGMVLGGRAGDARRWAFPRLAGGVLLVLLVAALIDYDRAAAPMAEGGILDWGATPQEKLAAARASVLFRTHVDLLMSPMTVATDQNHDEVLAQTEELMHFGPEPQVMAIRMAAFCLANDVDAFRATERAFRLGFPVHYAEFRQEMLPRFLAHCGLKVPAVQPGDLLSVQTGGQ